MGRAIVVACAVLLLGGAGCAGEPEDTAEAVDRPAPTEATAEEPETTTTTTTRPTTTTTTAPPTTTTSTTTTTAPPPPTTTTPPPTTTAPPPPTTAAAAPVGGDCDPNYTGCVPIASDVDCRGGTGDGPAYADGPVTVVGSDIYDLDGNDDGIACES